MDTKILHPLVVEGNGLSVKNGTNRLLALKQLGYEAVPVTFEEERKVEYRTYSHADKAQRRELFALIGEYFASEEIRKEFTRAMSSDDTYTWVVALDGDEVAAFGALRVPESGKAELRHDYTLPAYRGRGINPHMVDMRIALAKQLGAKSIYTTIDPSRIDKYPDTFKPARRNGRWQTIRMAL